ncbi:arylsulfotransferase family protein [Calditrichota bacterium]
MKLTVSSDIDQEHSNYDHFTMIRFYSIAILLLVSVLFNLTLCKSSSASQPLTPTDGDTLNFTQALFQWHAIDHAHHYQLQIAEFEEEGQFGSEIVHEETCQTSAAVIGSGLNWGNAYVWRYIALSKDDAVLDTSSIYEFSIMSYPDSMSTIETTIFNRNEIQPGLNLFFFSKGYQAAFDTYGNCKLLVHGDREVQLLPSGDILCFTGLRGRTHIFRTTLEGDTVYISPQTAEYHHEVEYTSNGTYLTLGRSFRWVPNPEGVPEEFQGDSLLWKGDVILEFNADGDTVWSWNTHDHFSYEDFADSEIEKVLGGGQPHDWTHSNAAHFTPDGNAIYLSTRHLNRITLIDYPSGDIIWNMGKDMPSGDVTFGDELNFSYQHDPEWQDNSNILLFDNHQLGPEDSSRAIEISIDMDANPIAEIVYEAWRDTIATFEGDADRLENGNTLVSFGSSSVIVEYNENSETVWELRRSAGPTESSVSIYRCQRIEDLYPLVFTVDVPAQMSHVPAGESYFTFTVNNLGWAAQQYIATITDTEGWFGVQQSFTIDEHESSVRTVPGFTVEGICNDTVTVEVYPVDKPTQRDSSIVVICSDPELSNDDGAVRPVNFVLERVYPNPFNSSTAINFSVSIRQLIKLDIYDITGKHIRTVCNIKLNAGTYILSWDGQTDQGISVPSGVYMLKTNSNSGSSSVLLHLMR